MAPHPVQVCFVGPYRLCLPLGAVTPFSAAETPSWFIQREKSLPSTASKSNPQQTGRHAIRTFQRSSKSRTGPCNAEQCSQDRGYQKRGHQQGPSAAPYAAAASAQAGNAPLQHGSPSGCLIQTSLVALSSPSLHLSAAEEGESSIIPSLHLSWLVEKQPRS